MRATVEWNDGKPLLRRTIARYFTSALACRHLDAAVESFVAAFNEARAKSGAYGDAAPLLQLA